MEKEQYQQLEQNITPPTPYLKNAVKAFVVGGLICTIGQAVFLFYIVFF
ncbi:Stage V sporulation protein AC OS=Lysinibacillus sphaericus OX=1421 GN=LS41612_19230 PE=4 SV=1 [Lysinibacillus sphaericus]